MTGLSTVWERACALPDSTRPGDRFVVATAPFVLYLAASVLILGPLVLGDLDSTTIGTGPDPAAFVWIVKWWPQALANGWNPLHTDAAYAPDGFNMTWVTSIPGPSLALAPLTALGGPIVSYNVLAILIPALDGWAAFALCRGLGSRYLAAVLGGYLFGFSTYVMFQGAAHPHAALVAALPLAVLLVVMFLRERITGSRFAIGMFVVLTVQFLISVEVFLTMTMVGTIALALAAVLFPEERSRLWKCAQLIVVAYLLTAFAVSPYLYANLSEPNTLTGIDPVPLATDPFSIAVPTRLTEIGGMAFKSVGDRFTAGGEGGAYIGIPLLILLGLFGWQQRRERVVRYLLVMLALGFVISLGPRLSLLGHITAVRLPWTPFIHLPITEYVIPSRLIVYTWLPLSVLVALGLSARGSRIRWALALVGSVMLLPATDATSPVDGATYWHSSREVPSFFREAQLRWMLPSQGAVLVLPYAVAHQGESMIWQAEADMSFAMPDGYLTAITPPDFACWPVEGALRSGAYEANSRPEFLSFLASKDVRAIVVAADERHAAEPLLSALRGKPRRSGGVYVYSVPTSSAPRDVAACPVDAEPGG
jgi:hypothetical protein